MFLAIIIFIALVIEVLKYLTGGKSKDFWGLIMNGKTLLIRQLQFINSSVATDELIFKSIARFDTTPPIAHKIELINLF